MNTSAPLGRTLGILGAGRVGTAVARRALTAGYTVNIATARPPEEELSMLVDFVAPGATAVDAPTAAAADLVVVAVPLHKYRTLDPALLAGSTVIDAMNYWAPTDGAIADFENDPRSTSEVIQTFLADSSVVKTLNHIGYNYIDTDGTPAGSPGRRALALAGDDEDANRMAADFIDRMGFEPVDVGPLSAGCALQPGTPIFNGSFTSVELQTALARLMARACV